MPAQPPRRTTPVPHLLPQVTPVEKALLARAGALELASRNSPQGNELCLFLAAEFRALAEELHWWD